MNMNLVVLCGRLTAPPEIREFESGATLIRSLITVRSDAPRRRVDVVPVTLWDPASDHPILTAAVGEEIWATGSVQRRFWSSAEGRQSRLEVVAHHVQLSCEIDPAAAMEIDGGRDSVTATVE
jgi:single-strand DNA-binding protein